jgi:hypothetical protein
MSLVLFGTFKIAGRHRIDVSSGKLECEDFGLRFWSDVYELDSKICSFQVSCLLLFVLAPWAL